MCGGGEKERARGVEAFEEEGRKTTRRDSS